MKNAALLGAIAVFALMSQQAHASALIANCTLKAGSFTYTMPSPGEKLFNGPTDKDFAVDAYDEHGGQWAFIESPEANSASLTGCASHRVGFGAE